MPIARPLLNYGRLVIYFIFWHLWSLAYRRRSDLRSCIWKGKASLRPGACYSDTQVTENRDVNKDVVIWCVSVITISFRQTSCSITTKVVAVIQFRPYVSNRPMQAIGWVQTEDKQTACQKVIESRFIRRLDLRDCFTDISIPRDLESGPSCTSLLECHQLCYNPSRNHIVFYKL